MTFFFKNFIIYLFLPCQCIVLPVRLGRWIAGGRARGSSETCPPQPQCSPSEQYS